MTTFKVHFDGRVLVPEEPLDLPVNCPLEILIRPAESAQPRQKSLIKLAEELAELPKNPHWPRDGASQHDHYLYGLPKRP